MAFQDEIMYGLESEQAEHMLAQVPAGEAVFEMYGPDTEDVPVDEDAVYKAIHEPVVDAETGTILLRTSTPETNINDTPRVRFGKFVVSTQASWHERTRDSRSSHEARVAVRDQARADRAKARETAHKQGGRPTQRWNVGLSRLAIVDQENF